MCLPLFYCLICYSSTLGFFFFFIFHWFIYFVACKQLQWNLFDEINEDEIFRATLQHVFFKHNDATQVHGGSQLRYGPNIVKDRQLDEERIMHDYYCENPIYDDQQFHLCYKMKHFLFLWIVASMSGCDSYLMQWWNVYNTMGVSTLQKCITSIWMFAYNVAINALDEYCHMGESTTMEGLKWFMKAMQ